MFLFIMLKEFLVFTFLVMSNILLVFTFFIMYTAHKYYVNRRKNNNQKVSPQTSRESNTTNQNMTDNSNSFLFELTRKLLPMAPSGSLIDLLIPSFTERSKVGTHNKANTKATAHAGDTMRKGNQNITSFLDFLTPVDVVSDKISIPTEPLSNSNNPSDVGSSIDIAAASQDVKKRNEFIKQRIKNGHKMRSDKKRVDVIAKELILGLDDKFINGPVEHDAELVGHVANLASIVDKRLTDNKNVV